jgi:hypothetical protein
MTRTRNPNRVMPACSRTGRVLCADGHFRTRYQANKELTCSACAALIRRWEHYTTRMIAVIRSSSDGVPPRKTRRRLPCPICWRCSPFEEIEEEA